MRKKKTTDLRGSPINWLRPREEGEQFYYGEAKTELQNRVCHSVYIYIVLSYALIGLGPTYRIDRKLRAQYNNIVYRQRDPRPFCL